MRCAKSSSLLRRELAALKAFTPSGNGLGSKRSLATAYANRWRKGIGATKFRHAIPAIHRLSVLERQMSSSMTGMKAAAVKSHGTPAESPCRSTIVGQARISPTCIAADKDW